MPPSNSLGYVASYVAFKLTSRNGAAATRLIARLVARLYAFLLLIESPFLAPPLGFIVLSLLSNNSFRNLLETRLTLAT